MSEPALASPPPDTIHLRAIGVALSRPRGEIEDTFVAVSGRLAEGAGLLTSITRTFEALPARLDSPEIAEAAAGLAGIGAEAASISAAFASERADLDQLERAVAQASRPIGDLRGAVRMMGIVAINARVVAAGVVGKGDDFDVFTTDIADLSAGASKTLQQFTLVYQQLADEVARAVRQRGLFEESQAASLAALPAQMEEALAAVAAQRGQAAEGSAQAGAVTRRIGARIADAVMVLQTGDATRQRLEHVESALALTADATDAADIAALGALAAAQLKGALEDFEADVAAAAANLADLARDAGAVMDRGHATYGAGGESALAALNRQVAGAAAILLECDAERGKLESIARAVSETVDVLLGHVAAVQEIEANMRLVSLNAAVKCARLGPRGAALNVIARQLRELTGETVIAAEAVMAALGQAAELTRAFTASATGDAAGRVGRMEVEARSALALLQAVDGSFAAALSALDTAGPRVIAMLDEAAHRLAVRSATSETLRDLHQRLVEAMPLAAMHLDMPTADLLETVRRSYTMDAERHIHAGLFPVGLAANDVAPAEPPSAAEGELDYIFF